MLVGNFELNLQRRPIWAWLKLFLTPKRDHVKTQTIYIFRLLICFYIFSRATLNKNFTAKHDGVLPRAP